MPGVARQRLVHEVNVSSLSQGACQKGSLLLSAGKLADLLFGQFGHANLGETLIGPGTFGTSRAANPAKFAISAHQHHIEHADGKIPVDTFALGHVSHPVPLRAIRFAEDPHFAGNLRYQIQHQALSSPHGYDHPLGCTWR